MFKKHYLNQKFIGWETKTLSDLGTINRGKSKHRPRNAAHLYGGPYPFVQTGDIKNSNGRITEHSQTYSEEGLAQSKLWPKGTLAITIAANIAETAILTYPACFPDSVVGFIADPKKSDVRFVYYLLQNLKHSIQYQHSGTGSVQDNLNLDILSKLRLRVPDLSEQKRIAHILGTLDDKIEINRQINKTLEAMAQAIFKSWFIDFDPVKAKIKALKTGKDPLRAAMGAISGKTDAQLDQLPRDQYDKLAHTASLFPDKLVPSPLGDIPDGWQVTQLSSFCTLSTKSISPNKYPSQQFEHFSIPAFDLNKMPEMVLGNEIKSNKYLVYENSILVSKLNPQTPRIWYPFPKSINSICSTEFMQFIPRSKIHKEYVYLLMKSERMKNLVCQHVTGSTGSRQRAQPSQIIKINVIYPSETVLQSFHEKIISNFYLSNNYKNNNGDLKQLRSQLLNILFQ